MAYTGSFTDDFGRVNENAYAVITSIKFIVATGVVRKEISIFADETCKNNGDKPLVKRVIVTPANTTYQIPSDAVSVADAVLKQSYDELANEKVYPNDINDTTVFGDWSVC